MITDDALMYIPEHQSRLPVLPDGIARCRGVGEDGEWREGCDDCARRLAPVQDEYRAVWMEPPAIIAFECEFLIYG